jgi:hypothetical protein
MGDKGVRHPPKHKIRSATTDLLDDGVADTLVSFGAGQAGILQLCPLAFGSPPFSNEHRGLRARYHGVGDTFVQ